MNIGSINISNANAVSQVGDAGKPDSVAAMKQQLFAVKLEEQLSNTIEDVQAMRRPMGGAKNPSGSPSAIDSDLRAFWDDMPPDDSISAMEEGWQRDHDYDRNKSHLEIQGSKLHAKVAGMPDGEEKNTARTKLENFLSKENARLDQAFLNEGGGDGASSPYGLKLFAQMREKEVGNAQGKAQTQTLDEGVPADEEQFYDVDDFPDPNGGPERRHAIDILRERWRALRETPIGPLPM